MDDLFQLGVDIVGAVTEACCSGSDGSVREKVLSTPETTFSTS